MYKLDNKNKKPIDYINSEEMRKNIDLFLKDDKQVIEENLYKLILKTNVNVLNSNNESFEDFAKTDQDYEQHSKVCIYKNEYSIINKGNTNLNTTIDLITNINNIDLNTNLNNNNKHNESRLLTSFLDFKSERNEYPKQQLMTNTFLNDNNISTEINLDCNHLESNNK